MDLAWLFLSLDGAIGRRTYAAAQFALGLAAGGLRLWVPTLPAAVLVLAFPTAVLMVKRLHDMGQSGVLVLVPVAGAAWLAWFGARSTGGLTFSIEIRPPFHANDYLMIAVTLICVDSPGGSH
jgi:uncharacterized membrane protein YhaH (DUF805 family)